jgi:tellurite resistance protein TehA-like permease
MSFWTFIFPLAAAANTVGHWAIAVPNLAIQVSAWCAIGLATATIALLAVLTVRRVLRRRS